MSDTNATSAPSATAVKALLEELGHTHRALTTEIGKRIVGQQRVVEELLVTLFSSGHALFVGVPGLAKTLLVSTLAESLSLRFNRVQFTPDLMPSDVTGTDIIDEADGRRQFRFAAGPVFCNLLLADEINRTPPKTQASLLQAMQERRVTAGGKTHDLPHPFFVFATQNPIEQEGTYPLPEAQLDRFSLMIDVGYPSHDEEVRIVQASTAGHQQTISPVVSAARLAELCAAVPFVLAPDHLVQFAVSTVRASRPNEAGAAPGIGEYIAFGAGPRAAQHLIGAAKARAALSGRFAIDEEDIRALAIPVLRHRLVLSFKAEAEKVSARALVEQLLAHGKKH